MMKLIVCFLWLCVNIVLGENCDKFNFVSLNNSVNKCDTFNVGRENICSLRPSLRCQNDKLSFEENSLHQDLILESPNNHLEVTLKESDKSTPRLRHDHSLVAILWPYTRLLARSVSYIKNPECHRDIEKFLRGMQELDLWALKMMDSSGKLPSGLLNGNINQLGDFDQCLSVSSLAPGSTPGPGDAAIVGKYCLAYLDIRLPGRKDMEDLLHSHGAMVSNFSDPGHRIARFSTASWGLCIPNTCTASDLEHVIATWAAEGVKDFQVGVKVEEEMCYTETNEPASLAKHFAIAFFLLVFLLSFLGTVIKQEDTSQGRWWEVLHAFSVRRNWAVLFSSSSAKDEITCLHGVRALSALALVIFHKSTAIMFNPYTNRTAMTQFLGLAWTVIGRTASIYTDSFILLSGLLTSHGLLKELDRKGTINLKEKYWNRLWRIVPTLLAVILFCTYILVDLGSGPQWGLVVKHHSDLCKTNMWRNFLFIHNYFGFENMCLTHTHQLGIDMQLFLVSPLLVWVLWRHRTAGVISFIAIGVLSTVLRYTVALENQLSPVLYFGASVKQMFATANMSYILPSHRATVYVMGIALGFLLKRVPAIQLTKMQAGVGWVLSFSAGLYAMCGPYELARRGYQYSAKDAAYWNAGAPILWSVFIGFSIILCAYGHGGWFNEFLSWRGFVVFTRLAYAVYLTQFPIFFYSVGSQRTAEHYTPAMLFNITEVGVILVASIVFTLLFDLPFQHIKKISWSKAEHTEPAHIENSKPKMVDMNESNMAADLHDDVTKGEETATRRAQRALRG